MSKSNETEQSRSLLLPLAGLLAFLLLTAGLVLAFKPDLFGLATEEPTPIAVVSEPTATDGEAMQADTTTAEVAVTEPVLSEASIGNNFSVSAMGANLSAAETTGADFGQLLPKDTQLGSAVYVIEGADGAVGNLRVAVPDGADANTLDLYAWDGADWSFVPSRVIDGQLVSAEISIPQAIIAAQSDQPAEITRGIEVLPTGAIPTALLSSLSEISVGTLTLGPVGALLGDAPALEPGAYAQYLRVTNTGIVVDADSLSNILNDKSVQAQHIGELVSRVFGTGYAGLNLDYQGATAAQQDDFSQFVSSLNAALTAQALDLTVTVAQPQLVDGQWDTAGQDWAAIGQIADTVYLQLPIDPTAYGEGGLADQMVAYATTQINRHNLSTLITSNAIDKVGDAISEVPSQAALANFGQLQLLHGSEQLNIGDSIELGLSGSASPLEWDGSAVTFKYSYEQSGQTHTVWLDNESALAHRLNLAQRHNLRGSIVRGLDHVTEGAGYLAAFDSMNGGEAPAAQAAALVWTVSGADGEVVASEAGGDKFTFVWADIQQAGDYNLNVDFALGDNRSALGSYALTVVDPVAIAEAEAEAEIAAAEVVTDTVTTEETASSDVVEDDSAEESADEDTTATADEDTTVATSDNSTPNGTLTIETNFRQGPGFSYAINEILPNNTPLVVHGRDSSGKWLDVTPAGSDTRGWVYSQLVQLDGQTLGDLLVTNNTGGAQIVAQVAATSTPAPTARPVTAVPTGPWFTKTPWPTAQATFAPPTLTPIPTAVPPTATPTKVWPTATKVWPTKTPWPTSPPSAPPPPVAGGGGFELGGQTHTLANPALMQDTGMKWVKFQHKWSPGDTGNAVADRVANAKAQGFKVLLSMPGSDSYPTNIDAAGYVNFLRSVAQLNPAPDAIEIWNEMNIDFEWPAGQISPSDYVNKMLKPGYQAIKAANSSIMVISGAPAPTGFDNTTNAWADDRYMAGVAAAGGGSYMDCIGVHYNAGATSPNSNSGHPADGGAQHYSWYYNATRNMYYNTFGGSRKICFTELGYLSMHDYSGVPAGFTWAKDTTIGQHAQWLAEAVSLSANSGHVRMLIVFNVDFTHYDPNADPQAGYGMIRANGSCPACDTIKAVMGR